MSTTHGPTFRTNFKNPRLNKIRTTLLEIFEHPVKVPGEPGSTASRWYKGKQERK